MKGAAKAAPASQAEGLLTAPRAVILGNALLPKGYDAVWGDAVPRNTGVYYASVLPGTQTYSASALTAGTGTHTS